MEHDILVPNAAPRRIADLSFQPNSLSSLVLDNGDTLLAVGGQEAELHLSLYGSPPSYSSGGSLAAREPAHRFGRQRWKTEVTLEGASINNSVLLTSLSLTGSNESSAEPRIVVSNNDRTVKFFDIATRSVKHNDQRLSHAGHLRLDVAVNHSSISPDGRTLLSVGDSPDVFLHRITGGARITFSHMMKLSLSRYINFIPSYSYGLVTPYSAGTPVPASFSTAFSANGSKFAVASQEGVVVVWDVRSSKPLKVIQTDKERPTNTAGSHGNGGASGWISEPPFDWAQGSQKAPGWGVRSVKFSPRGVGREVMTFTEHTSLLHVVDAQTFETEEIIRVPPFDSPPATRPITVRQRSDSPASISSRSTVERAHMSSSQLPPPPRIMLFSGALEDTFRIPSIDTTGRRRQRIHGAPEDDSEGIVVIPPLGDREVDDDVRRLIEGRHAITLRIRGASHPDDEDGGRDDTREDEMDVDELDPDCVSSYSPSRAASPTPSPGPSSAPSGSGLSRFDPVRRAGLLERRESASPYLARRGSSQGLRRHQRRGDTAGDIEIDQDLAGTCFDPSGEYIYVGAMGGIAEWKVRGAEQRWWSEATFA
ncbi:uncharacterized protein PHACADRAFT_253043 [Phanerochaete carnosa HHB-10118-sp]|uniref:DUF2415 domain-containing protein n=1 Tax=Phanerochaete carnosa (strain HHB-10118-sp) TaxID=650164 RepID=K5V755_PHACS|nr:uncharacterized protein PHACADRAFT_253043 [Phanerochaete carnosa HHB-10118-sp]EKM58586.1 hypothetical protein PHACADRAFT_253043 [Phanerochaete carnosa HHB-10118-sp]